MERTSLAPQQLGTLTWILIAVLAYPAFAQRPATTQPTGELKALRDENRKLKADNQTLAAEIVALKAELAAIKKLIPANVPPTVKAPKTIDDVEEFNKHIIGMSLEDFAAILDSKPIMDSADTHGEYYRVGCSVLTSPKSNVSTGCFYSVTVVKGKIVSFTRGLWQ